MTGHPKAAAQVAIRALRKDYGEFTALHSLDLDISPGEFISLLGPSGCGKTTLLRCIAGLVAPTSGGIDVGGQSVTDLPIHRRNFGMVFQSYALFPHMSVTDNVAFGLKMAGVRASEREERVAEALNMVSMSGMAHRFPSELSGGQQQRVALARAIVTKPKLLLLDEPFGALDAKLRTALQIELRKLQRRLGVTTIFVTHDQEEAMIMSDRIAVMSEGTIHQIDAPTTVYDQPATRFVADFVGTVNSFERGIPGLDIPEGGCVIVRPERVVLEMEAPSDAIVLKGTAQDLIFTGDAIVTGIETPVGRVVASAKNTGRWRPPAEGDAVTLWWRASDMVAFGPDGQTVGDRIRLDETNHG